MIYVWCGRADDLEEHRYETRAVSDKVESWLGLVLTSVNLRKHTNNEMTYPCPFAIFNYS